MQYIDTSPAAIEHRAAESMRTKHHAQLAEHVKVYGKLGELQTKRQKETLKRHLKQQAKQP